MRHATITGAVQERNRAELQDAARDLAVEVAHDYDGCGWVGWAVSSYTGRDTEYDEPVGESVFFDRREDAALYATMTFQALRV